MVSEQTCEIHTKWTKAFDERLNRLLFDIHHTWEYKQYCLVGNMQNNADFAGVLEDSKSTSGGTLCIFGSHTFVPASWMCKKQTSVSHSSTESEIISLDAGLRLDGLLFFCERREEQSAQSLKQNCWRSNLTPTVAQHLMDRRHLAARTW